MGANLVVDEPVFWLTGGAGVVWFILQVFIPQARRELFRSKASEIGDAAARLRVLSALSQLAGIASLSGAAAIIIFSTASYWLNSQGATQENLEKIVRWREEAGIVLDAVGRVSGEVWLGALGVLALIWLLVARSSSRKRWEAAVEVRKRALNTETASMSDVELVEKLGGQENWIVREVYERADTVRASNAESHRAACAIPVVAVGEANHQLSIADLEQLQRQFEVELSQMAENGESSDQLEDMDPSDTQGTQIANVSEKAEALAGSIETIKAVLIDIGEKLPFRWERLDGATVEVPIGQFDPDSAVSPDQIAAALRVAYVRAELNRHREMGVTKPRKEPELLREWLGAVLTSKGTVQLSSRVGRAGGALALAAVFAGLFGFTAHAAGQHLFDEARQIELSLLADRNSASAEQALVAASQASAAEDADDEFAEDEETEDYVRQAFRSAIARDLALTGRQPAQIATTRRASFELAAARARQEVLAASSRAAAPGFDLGADPGNFASSHGGARSVATSVNEVVDDAAAKYVRQLRSNPTVWNRMRAEAARPATSAFIGDAFFDTVVANADLPDQHALKVYADKAASDFTRSVAQGGSAHGAQLTTSRSMDTDLPMTAAERRQFADFKAAVPERGAAQQASYRSGVADPGSLNRVATRSSATSAFHPSGGYADLFPATVDASTQVAEAATSSDRRAPGRPSVGGGQATRPTAQAARSFSRIRFSGRVGGVVIGREPSGVRSQPDIVGFSAVTGPGGDISITLAPRRGSKVVLGPFHPAIVHHALAYAADGRVVVTTLPQMSVGEGEVRVPARQVIVHPAFEDTAFACPAIQIDRFVDQFMFSDAPRTSLAALQGARESVTTVGYLLNEFGNAQEDERSELPGEFLGSSDGLSALRTVGRYTKTCGTGSGCFPLEDYERLGMQFAGSHELLACLARGAPGDCTNELSGLRPQATYAVDSGVREAPFELDAELEFLRPPAGQGPNSLWPLDFIIQAVPQTLSGEDIEVPDNWDPWEFPAIAQLLREEVQRGIGSDPASADVFAQMQQFVILQRMFRLALAGDLGLEFPIEKLIQLQKGTRSSVRVVRSEKWNLSEGLIQYIGAINSQLMEGLGQVAVDPYMGGNCGAAIKRAIDGERSNPWPQGAALWEFLSQAEKFCAAEFSGTDILEFRDMLRRQNIVDEAIRIATLGSAIFEPTSGCAPL